MGNYVNIYHLVAFCQLFTRVVYSIYENVNPYVKYY